MTDVEFVAATWNGVHAPYSNSTGKVPMRANRLQPETTETW